MRLGYMGSPAISARLLSALLADGEHEIACVVSNPDSPRGRSKKLVPTEVSALALEKGLPLLRPETLRKGAATPELAQFGVDLFVVFAYGRLLPRDVFELPPCGTINLHASVLPLLRGASPIQSALLAGFSETGWSVQFIEAGMDTGDVLSHATISVNPDETAGELTGRLVPVGIELVRKTLRQIAERHAAGDDIRGLATPQDDARATHCPKITTAMAEIDWTRPAAEIHNQIRALNPRPIARSRFVGEGGGLLKIQRSRVLPADVELSPFSGSVASGAGGPGPEGWRPESWGPGTFAAARLGRAEPGGGSPAAVVVQCGEGRLQLLELQPENRRALSAKDFLNGYRSSAPTQLALSRSQQSQ